MKRRFRITVNGKVFDVEAEPVGGSEAAARPQSVRPIVAGAAPASASAAAAPARAAASAPQGGPGDVLSPLAGKVVSIDAPVGTQVKAGDKVVTLEAMKMNTTVSAETDGEVKAVHVAAGDAVEEGQPLLTLA